MLNNSDLIVPHDLPMVVEGWLTSVGYVSDLRKSTTMGVEASLLFSLSILIKKFVMFLFDSSLTSLLPNKVHILDNKYLRFMRFCCRISQLCN